VEGVRLATQLAQGSVIIELDCVRVVKVMKEKKTSQISTSSLLKPSCSTVEQLESRPGK
jgi:hypothetical protein